MACRQAFKGTALARGLSPNGPAPQNRFPHDFSHSVAVPTFVLLVALLLLALSAASFATSYSDLPAALQAIPPDDLVHLFSLDFEPPNLAAEIAHHHAWAPNPADPADLVPGLVQVLKTYPGTADARRSLLDIGHIYLDKKDWAKAEAPFRYVMEVAQGKPEARIAHLRLLEMYSYWGAPEGVDLVAEFQAATKDFAGTPEEGHAKMLLGDYLVKQGKHEEGFLQYRDVLARFSGEPFGRYTRLRYALALLEKEQFDKAIDLLVPLLDDPIWSGRAYWVRGRIFARQQRYPEAIADLTKASQTADSVWVRGRCYYELGRAYTEEDFDAKARDCFVTYLRFLPDPAERLDVQITLLQNLLRAKRFVEAAEMATGIEMEIETAPSFYAKDDPRGKRPTSIPSSSNAKLRCRPSRRKGPPSEELAPMVHRRRRPGRCRRGLDGNGICS